MVTSDLGLEIEALQLEEMDLDKDLFLDLKVDQDLNKKLRRTP